MATATMTEVEAAQVRVTFTTTEEDIQLPEGKRQLIVPADIRRYGLSRILNSESMLDTHTAIPFDFLVNGTFLRTTLEDYLSESGLSLESNITLQYVRSLIPPVYEASFEHDDWVSSVDVLSATSPAGVRSGDKFLPGQDRIVSGSYDGLVRIWNGSGQVIATSAGPSGGGHTSSVKAVQFLSATQVASAGMDRTIRVWNYAESDDHFSGVLKPTLELYGHKASIDALATDKSGKHLLSASADGSLALWTTSKKESPAAPEALLPGTYANKRRKLSKSVSTPQKGALQQWHNHSQPATGAIFDAAHHHFAHSVSLDHTLRTTDMQTGQEATKVPLSSALLSVCALPDTSPALLAAGTSARNVAIVDPRVTTASTSVMTLRGHVNKVVSLSASPENSYSLVSGSHDGTCRIWDLRSVRSGVTADESGTGSGAGSVSEAVYVINRESREGKKRAHAGEGCKVFSVVWDRKWGIVSGSEDKRVQINRGRDIIASN